MKTKASIIITLLLLLIITGCKKYPEGPLLSIKSVKGRIGGYWEIVDYCVNSSDSLNVLNEEIGNIANFYVDKPGSGVGYDYIDFYKNVNDIATYRIAWELTDDKKEILIKADTSIYNDKPALFPFYNQRENFWRILRLTSDEFKLELNYNNLSYLMNLKKVE